MLFFDDFMEAIENLPSELKDSFTAVRYLDLQAQNGLDSLQDSKKAFFDNCKYGRYSEGEKEAEYQRLQCTYDKVLACSEEKKDIYQKLIRKLNSELDKFRMELEADHSGITEQIEQKRKFKPQKVYQPSAITALGNRRKLNAIRTANAFSRNMSGQKANMDKNASSFANKKESKNDLSDDVFIADDGINKDPRKKSSDVQPDNIDKKKKNSFRMSSSQKHSWDSFPTPHMYNSTSPLPMNNVIDQPLSSSQLSSRRPSRTSRRPGRMLRDYEDSSIVVGGSSVGDEDDFAEEDGLCNILSGLEDEVSGNASVHSNELLSTGTPSSITHGYFRGNKLSNGQRNSMDDNSLGIMPGQANSNLSNATNGDDEDQKLYCKCQSVSYGDMIACDSMDCPYEWFHYECVGLAVAPRGQWFCPDCNQSQQQQQQNSTSRSLKKRPRR